MKRFALQITGRVQGVGFRYVAAQRARSLALSGFARNDDTPSVSIEVQGEETALQSFLAWCRRGPQGASVESLQWKEVPPQEDEKIFVIV
ncbi:MAG: hypothetical protein A3B30_02850 [Candidatus Komeilibacteria bacterium RIFCSPLOWO2_01_FULL_52_15]|uniref:acylphosphatase n=1 Tax=Candidatus Komeilibacteria bacterium RIFCSPLOWO2_01_FULL_52_15 TaxID=1798551 RepID=A0A1G2BNF5_9BACT|nr:MAG: hypothetical protein A3B30_02850 [Candidatus Komeilibacteria bacterium RIFCSPLOWO2_01_FULL_52_15]